jgi:hypothetical protein
MRTIPSLLFLIASSFFCYPVTAQSINKTETPAQTGSVVAGRVMMRGTGLGGTTVSVWRWPATEPQPEGTWKTQTNESGNYRIANLPAGNYYISARSEGFITIEKGEPAHPRYFSIAAGATANDMDFEMVRSAAITGRVTNSLGQPVSKEPVRLIRVESLSPSPISGSVASNNLQSRTDDRGVYRLSGIPPGRYRAATGWPCLAMSSIHGGPAYARVFYPNVIEESKANVIEVAEGQEISDVDIALGSKVDLYSISGRLLDETDQAIPDLKFGLEILSDPKSPCGISDAGKSNSRGEFKIDNIPAGRYSIRVPPSLTPVSTPPPAFFSERDPFDVAGRDVINLDVHVMRTATVTGIVVLEGTSDKVALEKLRQLSLRVTTTKTGSHVSSQVSRLDLNSSFSVSGLRPGAIYWTVPEPFLVKRVERGNVVQDHNIELKAGEQISDIRLVLVYATASVNGIVKFVNGSPSQGTRVVARLWSTIPTQSRMPVSGTLVDSSGHFLMQNIPAGAYRLVLSAESEGMQGKAPMSQSNVVVSEGGVTQLSLTLDFQPTP